MKTCVGLLSSALALVFLGGRAAAECSTHTYNLQSSLRAAVDTTAPSLPCSVGSLFYDSDDKVMNVCSEGAFESVTALAAAKSELDAAMLQLRTDRLLGKFGGCSPCMDEPGKWACVTGVFVNNGWKDEAGSAPPASISDLWTDANRLSQMTKFSVSSSSGGHFAGYGGLYFQHECTAPDLGFESACGGKCQVRGHHINFYGRLENPAGQSRGSPLSWTTQNALVDDYAFRRFGPGSGSILCPMVPGTFMLSVHIAAQLTSNVYLNIYRIAGYLPSQDTSNFLGIARGYSSHGTGATFTNGKPDGTWAHAVTQMELGDCFTTDWSHDHASATLMDGTLNIVQIA